ncbi:putative ATP-dependent DNA helicase YjcD [compost metagenome]
MTDHTESLREVVDELEAAAKPYATIEAFIQYIDDITDKHAVMQEQQKHNRSRSAISLMSIHKSKGLEFPVVFVLGASEGILPHSSSLAADKHSDRRSIQAGDDPLQEALEEERRLAYVAVTRAQEELYISSPALYRGKPAELSRFIRAVFAAEEETTAGAETAMAWLCSSSSCKVWQRIITYEDAAADSRPCPVCQSPMVQGTKVLPRRKN